MNKDKYEKQAKELLGNNLYQKITNSGIDQQHIIALYHETGRNKKQLKQAIEKAYQDTEQARKQIKNNIKIAEKQLKHMKQLRTSILDEKIKQEMKNQDK